MFRQADDRQPIIQSIKEAYNEIKKEFDNTTDELNYIQYKFNILKYSKSFSFLFSINMNENLWKNWNIWYFLSFIWRSFILDLDE